MKKHFVFKIMLAVIVICAHNVASAAYNHDPTGIVSYTHDDASSIAVVADEATTMDFTFVPGHDIILAEQWEFRQRMPEHADNYLLSLPNHNLLPTKNIWLLGCAIRQC